MISLLFWHRDKNGQFGYLDNLAFASVDDGNAAPLNVTVGAEIATQNDFGVFQTIPNDPPIADDDSLTVAEDSVNTTIDVLAGDFDPDGDELTIVAVSNASNGTANIASDGLSVSSHPIQITMEVIPSPIPSAMVMAGAILRP